MSKNLFVCYSRDDYEFVTSFELEFLKEKHNSNFLNNELDVQLVIDKSSSVINLGDRYEDKIKKAIENSFGAIVFISKKSILSEFINNVEIPKILQEKKANPDYLILPIFIDEIANSNYEILQYNAPNSENTALRNISGDLKELIYKKFLNQLFENINSLFRNEIDITRQMQRDWLLIKKQEERKKRNLKKLGFTMIIIFGLVYTVLFPSDVLTEETANTPVDKQELSCQVFQNHYEDLEKLYNSNIDTYNKNVNAINVLIDFNESEEYRNFTAAEQKEYHTTIGLDQFQLDLNKLEELIVKIEIQGLTDVAEEHVELKRLLINTQDLSISNAQNGIESLKNFIAYVDNWEKYFEEWDAATSEEEASEAFERFDSINSQNLEQKKELEDIGVNLENNLLSVLEQFYQKQTELCGSTNS